MHISAFRRAPLVFLKSYFCGCRSFHDCSQIRKNVGQFLSSSICLFTPLHPSYADKWVQSCWCIPSCVNQPAGSDPHGDASCEICYTSNLKHLCFILKPMYMQALDFSTLYLNVPIFVCQHLLRTCRFLQKSDTKPLHSTEFFPFYLTLFAASYRSACLPSNLWPSKPLEHFLYS